LDIKYREWFGAGVVQNILFKNPGEKPNATAVEQGAKYLGVSGNFSTVGDAVRAAGAKKDEYEEILEQNESISIQEAAEELNRRYRRARGQGKEFEEAAQFTERLFTRIDEAFRFVGAAPRELADESSDGVLRFSKHPANIRTIDYKKMKFDLFVGDTSPGSGYSGVPEGVSFPAPTSTTTQNVGGLEADAVSAADPAPPMDRMSGAFPIFDTVIHTGLEATDAKTRSALANGKERAPSD